MPKRPKKKSRRPQLSPPFTDDEVQRLIACAIDYRSDDVQRSAWWEAFIRITWESGQELADLAQLRWGQMADDGTVRMMRSKTGIAVTFRLSSEAIAAARAIGDADRVLPWDAMRSTHFPREWRRFVNTIEGVRQLSAKYLRLAAVQRTVRQAGESAARRLLGHSPSSIGRTERGDIGLKP